MQKRKLIFAVGLCLLMTGCGTKTPERILGESSEVLAEAASVTGTLDAAAAVELIGTGENLEVETRVEGDWEYIPGFPAFHFDGTIESQLLGMRADVELYGEAEEGQMVLYINLADEWYRTELDNFPESPSLAGLVEAAGETEPLEEASEEKEFYILHLPVSETFAETLLKGTDMGDSFQAESIGGLEGELTIRVEKNSMRPEGLALELKSGSDVSALFDGKTDDFQVGAGHCTVEFSNLSYDWISGLSIPQEAYEGGETEPDELLELLVQTASDGGTEAESGSAGEAAGQPERTAEGAYILVDYDGEITVTIKPPVGYSETYLQKTYFSFFKDADETDEEYISMAYQIEEFDEYYTEDDYINNFRSQERNYEEYGYQDLEYEGPEKFQIGDREINCMAWSFSYGGTAKCCQVNMWEKLDEEHILQCSVYVTGYDMGELSTKPDEKLAKLMFEGTEAGD